MAERMQENGEIEVEQWWRLKMVTKLYAVAFKDRLQAVEFDAETYVRERYDLWRVRESEIGKIRAAIEAATSGRRTEMAICYYGLDRGGRMRTKLEAAELMETTPKKLNEGVWSATKQLRESEALYLLPDLLIREEATERCQAMLDLVLDGPSAFVSQKHKYYGAYDEQRKHLLKLAAVAEAWQGSRAREAAERIQETLVMAAMAFRLGQLELSKQLADELVLLEIRNLDQLATRQGEVLQLLRTYRPNLAEEAQELLGDYHLLLKSSLEKALV